MKQCLIFPVSMKNVGLLFHFKELAIAFYERLNRIPEIDFYIISEHGEQNPGLWDEVRASIPQSQIFVFDSSSEFSTFVEEKLKTRKYSQVLYLTQGIMQFLDAIYLKRRYKEKLWLYTRLNSFKHGAFYRPILSFFLSLIFVKYSDFVNFQCEYTARIFANSKAVFRAGKGGIIPLGLSEEKCILPECQLLVDIFEDEEAIRVIYLANFHKHKRQGDLISYMAPFLRKDARIKLILLGEGEKLLACRALAQKLDLSDQVFFTGRVERKYIPYVLSKSNLSMVFSKVETFGHNILEPLFYGTPVISSNVGIAPEVIKDFQSGALLFSEKAAEFETKARPFLCQIDPAQNSFPNQSIRENYEWDSVVSRYLRLFESVYTPEV